MKLTKEQLEQLKIHAHAIRRNVLTMACRSKSSHIGSSLSPIDILTVLFFDVMHIDPRYPKDPLRDRCILSKGHGAMGFYATLAERGFISQEEIERYGQNDTHLASHPVLGSAPGIEASTGSLGHGLSIGAGLALAAQRDQATWRSFVILSDGECDEGSTWEAVLFAGHAKLDRLVAIVDYNKIQSFGRVKEVLDLEPFGKKWDACHWRVCEVDGHDFEELAAALRSVPLETGKPTVIIAHTIKGKGVPYMEDTLAWHYNNLKPEDLEATLRSLT